MTITNVKFFKSMCAGEIFSIETEKPVTVNSNEETIVSFSFFELGCKKTYASIWEKLVFTFKIWWYVWKYNTPYTDQLMFRIEDLREIKKEIDHILSMEDIHEMVKKHEQK